FRYRQYSFALFPRNGCRGLTGNIVDDTVDTLDLVDDTGGNTVQYVIGDTGPVSSHKVAGSNSAEGQRIIVGAAVAHNAHGAGVGKYGEILVDVLVLTGGGDLLPVDGVGVPEGIQLLLGQIADHTDGQAGAGEGLAHDQVLGQAQLAAQLTHLILKQQPQGLDDLLEVHIVRQTTHVVVA